MRDGSGGAFDWSRRAGALAIAMAAIAMLVAACGGSNGSPSTTAQSKNYQKALNFVQCMRAHGVPTFPDPTSQGIVSDSQANVNSPLILTAYQACRALLPPGDLQLTEAQREQLTTEALKRAECMRTHGVPNFPDPGPLSAAAKKALRASLDPNSPVFQAAARRCLALTSPGRPEPVKSGGG
jgi:hypothetical protein